MLNVIFLSCFFALGVLCILLWTRAIKKYQSGHPLLEQREFEFPFGFIDVIVMFMFWCLGQMLAIGIAVSVLKLDLEKIPEASGGTLAALAVAMGLGQLMATAGAMCYLFRRYRSLSIFGWQPKKVRKDILTGVVGFLMVVPVVLLVQTVLTQFIEYKHATQQMLLENADTFTIFASWFSAVLVAPICEEIFFRGVLQGYLQRLIPSARATADQKLIGGWAKSDDSRNPSSPAEHIKNDAFNIGSSGEIQNPYRSPGSLQPANSAPKKYLLNQYWPIFVSAALFGLAHAGQGPAPIPLFLFGLALGYIFHRTGSIVSCIVVHMLLNAFSMFWFTLGVLFPPPDVLDEATPQVLNSVDFYQVAEFVLIFIYHF